MPAAYDNFDYPAFWEKREYEHRSEIVAIEAFLGRIKSIDIIADIGCGYGRLTPYYSHRARKVFLFDPCNKMLSLARKRLGLKKGSRNKTEVIKSKIETLPMKFKRKYFDVVIMVRVLHHIKNPEKALEAISKSIKKGGYLIAEFPNKLNYKTLTKNVIRGNLTYPFEIDASDIRCKKNKNKKTIPFLNYHPDKMLELLRNNNFEIIEIRSVSNVRNGFAKQNFPTEFLISIEKKLQRPLARVFFGPSIFILARKV